MSSLLEKAPAMAIRLLVGVGFCVSGCDKYLPPREYAQAFEAESQHTEFAGDYRITTMVLAPEYLLAREMDSTWNQDAIRTSLEKYGKAHYVSVQITLKNPTGGPEDLGKDFVNKSMAQGEESYRERVDFLQNQAAAFVRLHCADGRTMEPVSFHFTRGTGFPGIHNFLFLFPKEKDGHAVSLKGSHIILGDLGLATEALSLPLTIVRHPSLKT
jgi:hypothetical protein